MGSHYIPVGKLKIDKDLLDIACPAAGYTPELICPAAGWELIGTGDFIPPITIPDPSSEEIILLVSNDAPYKISVRAYVNTGNVKYDFYTASGAFLTNVTNNTGLNYDFTPGSPFAYYIIRITPATAGAVFTQFQRITVSGYNNDWQIISAKFNTPNITTLTSAFSGIKAFQSIEFASTLNALTSLSNTFANSGITSFKFPASLPELTTLTSTFLNAVDLIAIDFNSCSVPKLTSCISTLDGTSKLRTAVINSAFDAVTSLQYFLRNAKKLTSLTLTWGTLPAISSVTSVQQTFYGVESLVSLTWPYTESPMNFNSTFHYMAELKKLTILGKFVSNLSSAVRYCPKLEEVILPEEWGVSGTGSVFTQDITSLKKITMPTKILSPTTAQSFYLFTGSFTNILEVNGAMESVYVRSNAYPQYHFQCRFLKIFNKPLLQTGYINLGVNGGLLEYVEIDWANSFADIGSVAIVLQGNLSTSEINRIYDNLPTMLNGPTISINNNPGFATANHAIAQAKGWTVTGA